MQSFASEVLYHFVGRGHPENDDENFAVLCAVLRSMEILSCKVGGKRGGIRLRRDPTRPMTDGEPAEQSVVCLCDIPRDSLAFHARRYGRFGVGVSRSVVAQWGTRPVIYIPFSERIYGHWGKRFSGDVQTVLDGLDLFFPDSPETRTRIAGAPAADAQDAVDEASGLISRDFQAFLKFWDVDLPDGHPENFYLEREWRKFGNLELALCLREIVAPPVYHQDLMKIIDGHQQRGQYHIAGPVNCISVGSDKRTEHIGFE